MHCTHIFGGKTSFTQERVCLGPILIHWTLTHTHTHTSFHPTELYWSPKIFWQQHTHTCFHPTRLYWPNKLFWQHPNGFLPFLDKFKTKTLPGNRKRRNSFCGEWSKGNWRGGHNSHHRGTKAAENYGRRKHFSNTRGTHFSFFTNMRQFWSPESCKCVRRMGSRWSPSGRRSRWWPWCRRWSSLIWRFSAQPSHWECGASWTPEVYSGGVEQAAGVHLFPRGWHFQFEQNAFFLPQNEDRQRHHGKRRFSRRLSGKLDNLQPVDLKVGFPKLLQSSRIFRALVGWPSQAGAPNWTLLEDKAFRFAFVLGPIHSVKNPLLINNWS